MIKLIKLLLNNYNKDVVINQVKKTKNNQMSYKINIIILTIMEIYFR